MEFLEEKLHLCAVCGEAFTTQDALNVHKETKHQNDSIVNMFPEEKPSLCAVCSNIFMNKVAHNVHKESEHQNDSIINMFPEEKPHLCTVCGEAFMTLDALRVHKETEHPDNDLFNLFLCPESSGEEQPNEQYKQQISVKDPPESLQNETLTTLLKTDEPSFLIESQQTPKLPSGSEPQQCNLCYKTFADKEQHQIPKCEDTIVEMVKTDTKLDQWDVCRKTFTDKNGLTSRKQQSGIPEREDTITETIETKQETM